MQIVCCAGFNSFYARVFIAVGIASPNHLAVFAMTFICVCTSVSQFVTTELVSLGGASAPTLLALDVDGWKYWCNVKNTLYKMGARQH